MDLQQLIDLDKELFLRMNGSDSLFWDGFMWVVTSTYIWIPMFLVLLFVIMRNNSLPKSLLIIFMIALVVLASDQISSGLFKPLFQRWRPTQDPSFMNLVDIVNNYRGGRFGFVSSHAANSFALAVFLSLLMKRTYLSVVLFIWAIITSYSRIYLGVHYPGDILCGMLLGIIIGIMIFMLYDYLQKRIMKCTYPRSNQYTSTGFVVSDFNMIYLVLAITYFIIVIIGLLNVRLMML